METLTQQAAVSPVTAQHFIEGNTAEVLTLSVKAYFLEEVLSIDGDFLGAAEATEDELLALADELMDIPELVVNGVLFNANSEDLEPTAQQLADAIHLAHTDSFMLTQDELTKDIQSLLTSGRVSLEAFVATCQRLRKIALANPETLLMFDPVEGYPMIEGLFTAETFLKSLSIDQETI